MRVGDDHFLPDGPDKAQLQNLYMVEDRNTHTFPFERLNHILESQSNKRISNGRDFGWEQISTSIPGRSRALHYNSSTGLLLTGSVSGSLWRNDDYSENKSWSKIEGFEGLAISCLAADPIDENILYLGTGESFTAFVNYRESTGLGNGIYKSMDAGENWEIVPSTAVFYYVNDIIIREENGSSVLYVAVGSGTYETRSFVQEGLYRSTDNGATWNQVLPKIPGTEMDYQVSDMEVDSQNGYIYASTMRNSQNLGGSVILVSQDGVNWWIRLNGVSTFFENQGYIPGRSVIKVAPSNPDHIYAIMTAGEYNSLNQLRDQYVQMIQSLDGGLTYKLIGIPNAFNIPWHAMALAVDPNDDNKVVIGGLDTYVLNDASATSINALDWIQLSYWYAKYSEASATTEEQRRFFREKYVHADVHDLQFVNGNSNQLLIATDGGVFFSENLSVTNDINPQNHALNPENPALVLPVFQNALSNLNTTQYYHGVLHPEEGRQEAIGGTQDNGSIYRNWSDDEEYTLSGGDGGFSFFDRDDDDLRITMVYGNRYYILVGDNQYFIGKYVNGLFVNPVAYDDQSNLLYSNTATSSYGGLFPNLAERYRDTIQIVNVNKFLDKDDLGLDTTSFVGLNVNLREAITAIQLSGNSAPLDKTLFFGTENGQVYKVTGLPYNSSTMRIDEGQLPFGYISSIDVGSSEKELVVCFSNFGLNSIWYTRDGGASWRSIERNLPDMPVRWCRFNPLDNNKVIIATEIGIWGLESIADENSDWVSYNNGLPAMRVDMFDLRASDSKILAATHGHGFFYGTYSQGELVLAKDELNTSVHLFPNPTHDYFQIAPDLGIKSLQLLTIEGRKVLEIDVSDQQSIDISRLISGLYIVKGYNDNKELVMSQKLIKQ